MCNDIKDKSTDEQFEYFLQNAKTESVYEYGSFYLKNETFAL